MRTTVTPEFNLDESPLAAVFLAALISSTEPIELLRHR